MIRTGRSQALQRKHRHFRYSERIFSATMAAAVKKPCIDRMIVVDYLLDGTVREMQFARVRGSRFLFRLPLCRP